MSSIKAIALAKVMGGGGGAGLLISSHRAKNGYISGYTNFVYQAPSDSFSVDVFEVEQGKVYVFFNGASFGNRFRAIYTNTDPAQATTDIVGQGIITTDSQSTPLGVIYTAVGDGYVSLMSSNQGNRVQVYGICISDSPSGVYAPE